MRKDIFIDSNVASRFAHPIDEAYKKLVAWLMTYDEKQTSENAYLAVSLKLIHEYNRSNREVFANTAIPLIIAKLQRENRLHKIENQEIKDFQKKYFTKNILKKLQSNSEDRAHLPVVLLSDRKMALSIDDNFLKDLLIFKKFKVTVAKRPELLPYH